MPEKAKLSTLFSPSETGENYSFSGHLHSFPHYLVLLKLSQELDLFNRYVGLSTLFSPSETIWADREFVALRGDFPHYLVLLKHAAWGLPTPKPPTFHTI